MDLFKRFYTVNKEKEAIWARVRWIELAHFTMIFDSSCKYIWQCKLNYCLKKMAGKKMVKWNRWKLCTLLYKIKTAADDTVQHRGLYWSIVCTCPQMYQVPHNVGLILFHIHFKCSEKQKEESLQHSFPGWVLATVLFKLECLQGESSQYTYTELLVLQT